MEKLPISISPCPIIEAIFEVRFEASVPGDAIFGIIFNEFKNEFQNVEQLPILQLPAAIRSQDPNLKFSPHYKIQNDNFIIQIGPNVFSLANINEYCGWDSFLNKICEMYKKLKNLDLIKKQLRASLRYINIFQDSNIYPYSNIHFSLKDK